MAVQEKVVIADQKKTGLNDWMDSAAKHYKSFRAYAMKNKRVNPDGSIDKGWMEDVAKGETVWGKRARLALTMMEMHKDKEDNTKARSPEEA